MISERITNSTARAGLLTITDASVPPVTNDPTTNVTANGTADGRPTSNDEVNKEGNPDQLVADAKEGIGQSARIGNKVRTEDPKQFEFSEEQINECQKMTVSWRGDFWGRISSNQRADEKAFEIDCYNQFVPNFTGVPSDATR